MNCLNGTTVKTITLICKYNEKGCDVRKLLLQSFLLYVKSQISKSA